MINIDLRKEMLFFSERLISIVCTGLLLLAGTSFASGKSETEVLQNVLSDYLIPSYTHLEEVTDYLSDTLVYLCRTPNSSNLNTSQNAFNQVVKAWSLVEWFRIGPVVRENRTERFFFFPDRKNIGLRQVKEALRVQDPDVTDLNRLQKRSVAMQGLGALEYLLFDQSAKKLSKEESFRCKYALTVSRNLNDVAKVLAHLWQFDEKLVDAWRNPGGSNPFYQNNKEAMNTIIEILINGLKAIRDTRINTFLRMQSAKDQPKSAAFWRSNMTISSIANNLKGLEKLFNKSQIEIILPDNIEYRHLGNTIRYEFKQSLKTALDFKDAPVSELLSDSNQREKLRYLKVTFQFLIDRLNDEFAPATGLVAGFSFNDGD